MDNDGGMEEPHSKGAAGGTAQQSASIEEIEKELDSMNLNEKPMDEVLLQ